MPSAVIIRSPEQNNLRILVLRQTLADGGVPSGPAELLAVLDDGEEHIGEVSEHLCYVILEHGRNTSVKVPEPDAENDRVPEVIGAGDPHQPVPEPVPYPALTTYPFNVAPLGTGMVEMVRYQLPEVIGAGDPHQPVPEPTEGA